MLEHIDLPPVASFSHIINGRRQQSKKYTPGLCYHCSLAYSTSHSPTASITPSSRTDHSFTWLVNGRRQCTHLPLPWWFPSNIPSQFSATLCSTSPQLGPRSWLSTRAQISTIEGWRPINSPRVFGYWTQFSCHGGPSAPWQAPISPWSPFGIVQ